MPRAVSRQRVEAQITPECSMARSGNGHLAMDVSRPTPSPHLNPICRVQSKQMATLQDHSVTGTKRKN
jgi:hypothetical protein